MVTEEGRPTPAPATIVFDIGGTWFRSGVRIGDGKIVERRRRSAENYKTSPGLTIGHLQEVLLDYLVSEAAELRRLMPQYALKSAGISMGAALNSHTGMILNSGPLWGPASTPLDLPAKLTERDPDTAWTVVNDVSAGALHFASLAKQDDLARLTVVTVSTGIACRTYDFASGAIPVDRDNGLQGEIGHLPIGFEFNGEKLDLYCDCGGLNHLNAFCSGRGIEAVLGALAERGPRSDDPLLELFADPDRPREQFWPLFSEALTGEVTFAQLVLNAVTLPMAQVLINLFTLDPLVERVVFTGGVLAAIGPQYLATLLAQLQRIGLYQVTNDDPDFFRRRIVLQPDDTAGLSGAGIAAGLVDGEPARPEPSFSLLTESTDERCTWTLATSDSTSYAVVETNNIFSVDNHDLAAIGLGSKAEPRRALVILDAQLESDYGSMIKAYLDHHTVEHRIRLVSLTESNKELASVEKVLRAFELFQVPRRQPVVIAVGGGVLLDVVGMAAGLYRRGVPHIRVPTTLLAMIDAGVGAKVGVNFGGHKNRIGAFHPAAHTFIDLSFLTTLAPRQLRSGLAEALKLAIVSDIGLFSLLEQHGIQLVEEHFQGGGAGRDVIRAAVRGMLNELGPNLREQKLHRAVDFGHTFGPAIEMAASPRLLHGEAVALDIALSTTLAYHRRLVSITEFSRIMRLLRSLRLPVTDPAFTAEFLRAAITEATRHRGGQPNIPLPMAIGAVSFCNDISIREIERALAVLAAYS